MNVIIVTDVLEIQVYPLTRDHKPDDRDEA